MRVPVAVPLIIAPICMCAAGCAPSADSIMPIYVAPQQYQSLSCQEIAGEAKRVAHSAAAVAGAPAGSTDAGDNVIIWPTLVFVQDSNEKASALGRLKGEFNALVLASTQKNCGLKFEQDSARSLREAASAVAPP